MFIIECSFDDVLNRYNFDRKLRILLFRSIKQIELALRSILTNTLSPRFGPHWFEDKNLFETTVQEVPGIRKEHNYFKIAQSILRKTTIDCPEDQKAVFIKHYYNKYSEPDLPPSWMIVETLSMNSLSMLYRCLAKNQRREIATKFGHNERVLGSWFHSLTTTRNICAHHSRLWNRTFSVKPILGKFIPEFQSGQIDNKKLYPQIIIIKNLLTIIDPENTFGEAFNNLIAEHKPPIEQMGFSKDWSGFNL